MSADKMFESLGYIIDEDETRVILDNRDINIVFDKETRTINSNEAITFNLQELQAINKKVEELRMDKELNEAVEWLKNNIKYYERQLKFIETTKCNYYDGEIELYKSRIRIFNNILNYIQNSIPKEKVLEKIHELDKIAKKKDIIPETVKEEKLDGSYVYSQRFNADGYIAEAIVNVLKDLSEE